MITTLTDHEIDIVAGGHEVWTTIRCYNPLNGTWSEFKVLVPHSDWPTITYA